MSFSSQEIGIFLKFEIKEKFAKITKKKRHSTEKNPNLKRIFSQNRS